MSNKLTPHPDSSQPTVYQIRLKGHLDSEWTDWFDGLTITLEENSETLLTGPMMDQAALHGLLKKVRDLGMPLVSVNPIQFSETASISFKKRSQKMTTTLQATEVKDRKVVLSTLWIFVMFNYLYADVFTLFFNPTAQKETLAMPPGPVLVFAILMETAIAMVLLSRILKYWANRWANIAAGVFHTAFVAWSLFGGTQPLFYMFFAAIEIVCTLFITWYAWKWRNVEA